MEGQFKFYQNNYIPIINILYKKLKNCIKYERTNFHDKLNF